MVQTIELENCQLWLINSDWVYSLILISHKLAKFNKYSSQKCKTRHSFPKLSKPTDSTVTMNTYK